MSVDLMADDYGEITLEGKKRDIYPCEISIHHEPTSHRGQFEFLNNQIFCNPQRSKSLRGKPEDREDGATT